MKKAVALVIWKDADERQELLGVLRPENDEDHPGMWGFPATSLEEGESWEDAVHLAAEEKLGVEVEVVEELSVGDQIREEFDIRLKNYEVKISEGEPEVPQPYSSEGSVQLEDDDLETGEFTDEDYTIETAEFEKDGESVESKVAVSEFENVKVQIHPDLYSALKDPLGDTQETANPNGQEISAWIQSKKVLFSTEGELEELQEAIETLEEIEGEIGEIKTNKDEYVGAALEVKYLKNEGRIALTPR